MIPTITVFVDTPRCREFIDKLSTLGYDIIVDSAHGSDYNWFLMNTKCSHRLYNFGYGDVYSYTINSPYINYDMDKLDLMIAFKEEVNVSDKDWKDIDYWVWCLHQTSNYFDLSILEKTVASIIDQPSIDQASSIDQARKNTIDYNNWCKFKNGTGPWGKDPDGKIIGLEVPLSSTCHWGDDYSDSDSSENIPIKKLVYLVCYAESDGGDSYMDGLVIRGICNSKFDAEKICNQIDIKKISCSWGLCIKEVEMDTLFDSGDLLNEINSKLKKK